MKIQINIKRALLFFFIAWLIMDVLGTVSYMVLSLTMTGHLPTMAASGASQIMSDPVWRASNIVLPFINLPVWLMGALLYFRKPKTKLPAEAWQLGIFWLLIVLPLDFLHYVATPTPLTIGAEAFYIGQFPWIYIIYGLVLTAPVMSRLLKKP